MKLGSLPLVFIKVVIELAKLMYSFLDRVPLFTFSLGLGALAIDFMFILFLRSSPE